MTTEDNAGIEIKEICHYLSYDKGMMGTSTIYIGMPFFEEEITKIIFYPKSRTADIFCGDKKVITSYDVKNIIY